MMPFKKSPLFLAIFLVFFSLLQAKFKVLPYDRIDRPKGVKFVPSKVKIMNLDLPPLERIKAQFDESDVQKYKKAHYDILHKHIIFIPIMNALEHILPFSYDEKFNEEIRAWATFLREPVKRVLVWNYVYELFSFALCTSVISQNKNGEMIHGRNLDYPFRKQIFYMLNEYHYYKNGKLLYKSDGIIGFVAVLSM